MKTLNHFKVKTKLILLAFLAFVSIPLSAQLYYPTTGTGSGAVPPSGIANTFFGNSTGNKTTTGQRNVFFGHFTGAFNTSGEQNTFVGCLSGYANTTGSYNAFFGERAGTGNTTGGANTYNGYLSGYTATTASNNTFTGSQTGFNNTAGANSFYGSASGYANTSGASNSFYGYESGRTNTTASFNSFYGNASGKVNTTGSSNSFYGNESGMANTTASYNSFYGNASGKANTTGSSNSFFGNESGLANTTGYYNSFYGTTSGKANTTGYNNSFYGNESGKANTTGTSNSFFGSFAGLNNTTGSGNTFMGTASGQANAGGGSNSFYGNASGIVNTSGLENSFFGGASGFANTTGQGNVFMGWGSGANNIAGSNNTYIGTRAAYNSISGTENTCIGTRAAFGALGSGNTSLGYVAETAPNVNYSTALGHFAYVSTDYTIGLGDAWSGAPISVIIGKLAKTGTYSLETNGDIFVNGTFYPSDKQFKRDIENYTNALDVINKLRPVSYFFKDDIYFPQEKGDGEKRVKRNFAKEEQIGFIAQELELVLPNLVRTDKNGFKAVNYDQLFGVLTQGIKEQNVKITSLETQNKELMEKLEAVNALILSQQERSKGTETIGDATDTKVKVNGYISSVTPNPFSTSTAISYVIPENYKQASLSVVSEMGVQAAQIAIKESGKGMFVFVGETLKPGSYYCYLNIDGVIVDYKNIVLAK
jgi:hypothetical protein